MRVQTKTPVEFLGCIWKRRPLAIEWDGWGMKVLAVESHGEVEVNPPVDRVKCELPELNEFESNPVVSLEKSLNDKLEGVKNVSGSENENEKSLSMIRKYEKKPENKTVGKVTKRKTWTKLNNGLFGWKTINAKQTTSNSSKLEKSNFLPAIKGDQSSKISTGISSLKRKFEVGIRTGISSESDRVERDYLAKKPRKHGGNHL